MRSFRGIITRAKPSVVDPVKYIPFRLEVVHLSHYRVELRGPEGQSYILRNGDSLTIYYEDTVG